uniref:Phospholipid phosphatase 1 n=1 Tax=Meleagris gallopavo TaxID=9103 RepID=A0A803YIK9_MELGA
EDRNNISKPEIKCCFCNVFFSFLLAGLPFAILNSRRIPFQRGVFCSDESIRYPYKEDTISYKLLTGIIIILGETLSVFYNHLHSNSFVRNNYVATIYKAIGTFIFGAAASQSLTDIAKYSIGRLRPHFLAVCQPDWAQVNCSLGYIENFPCQGDKCKFKLCFINLNYVCCAVLFSLLISQACWKLSDLDKHHRMFCCKHQMYYHFKYSFWEPAELQEVLSKDTLEIYLCMYICYSMKILQ